MKNKFFNYKIQWFFNDIYIFNIYDNLTDFMNKNKFDNYFIVGGDDPMKKYIIFGKYKKEFIFFIFMKNKFKKILTNRGK